MQAQPTFEFSAILAAIIGTLWVSVPTPSNATRAAVNGPGGELRSGRVVGTTTPTNFLHATRSGSLSASGIERGESPRQATLSARSEHLMPRFQRPAWAIELGRRESNNMDDAIGDHGKAHGRYQFTAAAWRDTTEWRKKHGLSTYQFTHAHNEAIATQYVVSWFQLNRERYTAKHGHEPTIATLMEIHRRGLHGFQRGSTHQVAGQGDSR